MTSERPDDDIFGHLDDPTPPSYGGDALGGVVARGGQIRHRRRLAYTFTSAAAVVLLAGTAIGIAAANGPSDQDTGLANASPTPISTHTGGPKKSGKHHHGSQHPGGTTSGGTTPGGTGGGHPHHSHAASTKPTHSPAPVVTCATTPATNPPPTDPTATPTGTDAPIISSAPPSVVCTTITPTPSPTGTATMG